MFITNPWSVIRAETMHLRLTHQDEGQKSLAKRLKKSQSPISEGLKRAGYDVINQFLTYNQSKYSPN